MEQKIPTKEADQQLLVEFVVSPAIAGSARDRLTSCNGRRNVGNNNFHTADIQKSPVQSVCVSGQNFKKLRFLDTSQEGFSELPLR